MIISCSRRTDIPAFYADWLFNRFYEGYAYVRNPMNPAQLSEIPLNPEVVDGIVFWTKNPSPMLDRLHRLSNYPYYFQFTFTPYGRDLEQNLPPKGELFTIFCRLSSLAGKERVVWRYDPIVITPKYSVPWHLRSFRQMAKALAGYTEKCTVSFLDIYKKIEKNIEPLGVVLLETQAKMELLARFRDIAREYGLSLDTCAEALPVEQLGISRGACIDGRRLERIGNYFLKTAKDRNQRPECQCLASIDIGAYNTCSNGCLYCYANVSEKAVRLNQEKHNSLSPLLVGQVGEQELAKPRKVCSERIEQVGFFGVNSKPTE